MDINSKQIFTIVVVCLLVLFLVCFKAESNKIVRMITRTVFGFVCILAGNYVFSRWNIPVSVGINPVTLLVCALLGLPGTMGMFLVAYFL